MNILNLENDWEELANDVDELATQIQVPKSKQSLDPIWAMDSTQTQVRQWTLLRPILGSEFY